MIPFPTMHIADSVINRVLNTLEGETTALGGLPVMPEIPDTEIAGAKIEQAVSTPAQPAELPPQSVDSGNAGLALSSVMGGSPFDGALIGG